MSQVDVHKGPEARGCRVIFQTGCKVLFTVELKMRETARDEESPRADHQQHRTMHHLFSARCSFCRQHRIFHSSLREKLRWDAAAAWGAISISTQTLPSTDWISNPLNHRRFHSLCFGAPLQHPRPLCIVSIRRCTARAKEWHTTKARQDSKPKNQLIDKLLVLHHEDDAKKLSDFTKQNRKGNEYNKSKTKYLMHARLSCW